jgi:hypothetical protein
MTENFGLHNELMKRESLASVEVAGESIMDESMTQEYEEKPTINYGKHDRSIQELRADSQLGEVEILDQEYTKKGKVPVSSYSNNPKVYKIIQSKEPMKMTGQIILNPARTLIWRNLCMIGP